MQCTKLEVDSKHVGECTTQAPTCTENIHAQQEYIIPVVFPIEWILDRGINTHQQQKLTNSREKFQTSLALVTYEVNSVSMHL